MEEQQNNNDLHKTNKNNNKDLTETIYNDKKDQVIY